MISLIVLFMVASFMGRDFSFILTLGAVHSLSVSAAAMLELKILVNKFWKEGFAVGNIYARLHSYILILIPGFLLVFAPIFGALLVFFASEQLVLPVFLAIAFSEFAIMSVFVALEK
jgi:hypothetical protein